MGVCTKIWCTSCEHESGIAWWCSKTLKNPNLVVTTVAGGGVNFGLTISADFKDLPLESDSMLYPSSILVLSVLYWRTCDFVCLVPPGKAGQPCSDINDAAQEAFCNN